MIYLVGFVVLVATVASFTRLATTDEITAPWRVKIRKKSGPDGFWTRALECDRCAAVWVSPLPTAVALIVLAYGTEAHWAWWIILAALWIPISKAISYLAFLLIVRGEA